MSGDILIELINTLGSIIQEVETMLLNLSSGFNFFMVAIFMISLISLVFYIYANSSKFLVVGTK